MAHEVRVARLGWSMEQGTFLRWLRRDGERVEAYEPLYELEGEKGTQEVEAAGGGILRIPPDAPAPGSVLPVGALLGYLLEDGEVPPWEGAPQGSSPAAVAPAVAPQEAPKLAGSPEAHPTPSGGARPHLARRASSPRARRVARELSIDWRLLEGSGRGGRVREVDVLRAAGKARGVGR